jgi:flagellin-like protein
MNYRKFRKNAKALSPVIASIILIAVTVAVSVVVAAWMGGLTLGFMSNAEQATITNVVFVNSTSVNATILNSGTSSVIFQSATIDGNSVSMTATGPTLSLTAAKGTSANVIITNSGAFTSGTQYTIKITTAKGTGLVYTITAP